MEETKIKKEIYEIKIIEETDKGIITLKEFEAERVVSLDDYMVYLRNKKENFMELFPQDENDFKNLNQKEIESNLKKARALYKKKSAKDLESTNKKDVLLDIMKYEAKLQVLKYDRNAHYMTIGINGMKRFYFLKQGTEFYLFKW